jgi:hypothetical protein
VLFLPEIYNRRGFQGVIAEVKKTHPGVRLHTLHGTDFGGMLVRFICGECWLDLSMADPVARRRFGDGDPQGSQGHDAGSGGRRIGSDYA